MPVFCRVASIARLLIMNWLYSIGVYPERLDRTPLRVRLPEGLFVLARVVDQGRALGQGVAGRDLADDQGVVPRAGPVYDLAVEVGQAVEEERRAPRRKAVGDALELVVVLAARVREVGRDVYLIVSQDAEGEGLALQGDVVCVTVAPDGDSQARGTFGGLHHPRCRHGVGLTTTPGSHHVDPVGQVTQARQYRVAVSEVPVQASPSGKDKGILSGAGILRLMSFCGWVAS